MNNPRRQRPPREVASADQTTGWPATSSNISSRVAPWCHLHSSTFSAPRQVGEHVILRCTSAKPLETSCSAKSFNSCTPRVHVMSFLALAAASTYLSSLFLVFLHLDPVLFGQEHPTLAPMDQSVPVGGGICARWVTDENMMRRTVYRCKSVVGDAVECIKIELI